EAEADGDEVAANVDRRLVGQFRLSRINRYRNGRSTSNNTTETVLVFRADGTFRSTTVSAVSVTNRDGSGNTESGADSVSERKSGGTWSAGNGRLTVTMADGTKVAGRYEVFSNGVEVFLDGSNDKLLLEKME
ncbi:MAG: hypothetical protein AAGK78_11090, partial [Planctomycetota bacterium]